ncbi:hypothetical protein TL16_g00414 [Triparma laevis f. inornata]|uniref:Uncharacterized protein n=1 Tax=Triparma laevis f. inornata TaxID=1714386 RepID=A0A9W6ZD97_9STRA|nr:hypothetical protein TL16_g00414 [Triparma laevis f. inornata]
MVSTVGSSYDSYKASLSPSPLPPSIIHLSGGIFAEIIACIIYVPVDVTKERLQISTLSSEKIYKTSLDCFKNILANEGLMGIYKGYFGTVLSFGPFSGLYFLGYEFLKNEVKSRNTTSSGSADLTFNETLTCSLTAGALASWITTPLDLAKLRMQVSKSSLVDKEIALKYNGFFKALKYIHKTEGVKGLWRGGMVRVGFFTPATGITMGTFDFFKGKLKEF